jgi:hypothetical protein
MSVDPKDALTSAVATPAGDGSRFYVIKAIANFILFELAWFAAVIGGAHGWPIMGTFPAILVVAIHLASNRPRLKHEAMLVLGVTALGVIVETAFILFGTLHYARTSGNAVLPPIWITALWFAFSTLPHGSLGWLSGRMWPQLLLGAVFGPLSYLGGVRLGAATMGEPIVISLAAIGCGWALAMILIFKIADRLAS